MHTNQWLITLPGGGDGPGRDRQTAAHCPHPPPIATAAGGATRAMSGTQEQQLHKHAGAAS